MKTIDRREFTGAALAALAGAMLPSRSLAESGPVMALPTVRWGKHSITRVLVGHNPIKGTSHFTPELSREMKEYFAGSPSHGVDLLRRCEQLGINACQMGSEVCEEILRAFYAEGGKVQWIATFYSKPGEGKAELARILKMEPRPIGAAFRRYDRRPPATGQARPRWIP